MTTESYCRFPLITANSLAQCLGTNSSAFTAGKISHAVFVATREMLWSQAYKLGLATEVEGLLTKPASVVGGAA